MKYNKLIFMQFWRRLSKRRQRQFGVLLLLMLLGSLAEVVSLGAVIPFLGAITSPEYVFNHEYTQYIIKSLGLIAITRADQIILPLTIVFISAVIFAGIVRIALIYFTTRLSYATGSDISIDIYRRTLYQNYSVHISRNSSEVINGIIIKTGAAIGITQAVLNLITSTVILIGVIAALMVINIQVTLFALIVFFALYSIVISRTRNHLKKNSEIIASQSTIMIKSLQEGLGGIRDVLINKIQEFYCKLYRSADLPLRHASGNNVFIIGSPRYVMEAIGMSVIAIIAYFMTLNQHSVIGTMPLLGALALGAQRLLPALQQIYSSYAKIKGEMSSFVDVVDLLYQPVFQNSSFLPTESIEFNESICLNNVNFSYARNAPEVLKNINLRIYKGESVGFIGPTGCGKSTLVDLIMGLLHPIKGDLLVDNHQLSNENISEWQKNITHVPQNIYLTDGTVEENIAFGIEEDTVNHQRVRLSAKQAQILGVVESWKDGFQTIVGEQGVKLSGGQRQRIGIARALYKDAKVLVLDEATSALDNQTEKIVMDMIDKCKNDFTILIIAHRLSTLKKCDKIIKMDNGKIIQIGTYKDIAGKN